MESHFSSCSQAVAEDEDELPVAHQPLSMADNQPRSMKRDFDFVERPSQDFFCPVSLELLLEPQLTSCCGHHLSLEASARLHREGKACPMCNAEQWSAMLDKYHRRKVHEVRVRCWHKDFGCDWVGEVNGLKRHDDSCVNRPWECEYCGLRCTYEEGEGKHWPTCLKFPEPCPNTCEVGFVERCNMEQHLSVCPLEPVSCEMKEFGCSVMVPRKELARHMRESELQHLTAMTVMNLRLTRQLQQDSTERDRKIAQLQQEMTHQKKLQNETSRKIEQLQLEIKTKMDEQKRVMDKSLQLTEAQKLQNETSRKIEQLHYASCEMKTKMEEQTRVLTTLDRNMDVLSLKVTEAQLSTRNIEHHVIGECSGTKVFTFTQYSQRKGSDTIVNSDPFYSHHHGYKFKLKIHYYSLDHNDIGASLYLMTGLFDDQLPWPVEVRVRLEILNQAGDRPPVVKARTLAWDKCKRESEKVIDDYMIKYPTLERQGCGAQYMMNDCLKFKVIVTVL